MLLSWTPAGTVGGAVQVKREVRRGVKEIIQKVGVTSILVTHDRDEAFDIADKIVVFNRCGACAR